MDQPTEHILPYRTIVLVLISLVGLLAVNLLLALIDIGRWNVLAIMLISSAQVTIVLRWFMHLKHAKWYLQAMVAAVFLLILIVIVITFFDYMLR